MRSGLLLQERGEGKLYRQLLSAEGDVLLEDVVSPHQMILDFMEPIMSSYLERLHQLEQHPFFEDNYEISYVQLQDLTARSVSLTETLRADHPLSHYFSMAHIQQALTLPDDDLRKGALLLHDAELHHRTRIQVWNMMEISFGNTQELPQRQRYQQIVETYPQFMNHNFSVQWVESPDGSLVQEYQIHSLLEYYWFCLVQVFRSSKQICRCQHCWQYFLPKTQKKAAYCDRIDNDGRSCKELGANLKRHQTKEDDPYLQQFYRLQKRMYERSYRGYAHPKKDATDDYPAWMEQAGRLRMAYLRGEIDGDAFLSAVGMGEELRETEPSTTREKSFNWIAPWESLVAGDLNFDADQHFEDIQFLDLGDDSPEWQIITAEEQQRQSKHGNISLKEKYDQK